MRRFEARCRPVRGHRTTGHCSVHYTNGHDVEGTIIEGSNFCDILGKPIATVGCKVQADCGAIGILQAGSPLGDIEGRAIIRPQDPFAGDYTGVVVEGFTWTHLDD